MPGFSFWQKWLFVVAIVVAIFGTAMALISGTPLFGLFNRQIDSAFWGSNPVGESAGQFQQWVYGILGATIAGWGVFIAFVAHYPFRKKEEWAWNCILLGLLLWFVLDTTLSAVYRVYFNVVFNTALLVLVMLPIVFTRHDFRPRNKDPQKG